MWIHVGHLGLLWEASVLAKDLKTSSDFLMKRGTLLMFIVFSCFIQISYDIIIFPSQRLIARTLRSIES
jgi:hypothetical protein